MAMTPETVLAVKIEPLVLGPRGGVSSPEPTAPAEPQTYNIYGTGSLTPRRTGGVSPRAEPETAEAAELRAMRRQLRDTEI